MNWSHAYLYTPANVQIRVPRIRGLYRLQLNAGKIFYIGKANDLNRRLREHLSLNHGTIFLNEHLSKYLRKKRCFFRFAVIKPGADLLAMERRQISKYTPFCNSDRGKKRRMKWSRCYLYTRAHVKILSPSSPGIYRLQIKNRIFYVGQCRNIRRRLFEHLGGKNTNHLVTRYLQRYRCFFRFAELENDIIDLFRAERKQIRRYNPPCNMDIRTIEETARAPKPLRS